MLEPLSKVTANDNRPPNPYYSQASGNTVEEVGGGLALSQNRWVDGGRDRSHSRGRLSSAVCTPCCEGMLRQVPRCQLWEAGQGRQQGG